MTRTSLFALLSLAVSVMVGAVFAFPRFSGENALAVSPVTTELEQKVASGADILTVIAETKDLLRKKNLSRMELLKAEKRLASATDEFYRRNLLKIAESLGQRNGPDAYRKSFDAIAKDELKAEVSTRYRDVLQKRLLAADTIDVKSRLFEAFAYVAGKTAGMPSSLGTIPKDTMATMLRAEKWASLPEGILLDENAFKATFQEIGLYPWSAADLRTMRKAIAIEGLSADTRYVRAYVSAWKAFGRNTGTTRLYLRESLKHDVQKQALSCEANSIADYLNFYRLRSGSGRVTEDEAFSLLPKDDRLPELRKENGKSVRVWGDPEKAFVGKSNGKQSVNINQLTGYGIHASGALALVSGELAKLGYDAKIDATNPFNVLWSIYSGEPVLFWYVLSDNPKKGFSKLEWRTWDGESRTGYVGEHTGIIVGAEVSKNGDLLKLAYYEGTSEALHWENADDVLRKAGYLNQAIYASKR